MIRKILVLAVSLVLLLVLLTQSVSAGFFRNTFDPIATVSNNGRHVWVTAQIGCDVGESLTVEVTLTQEGTSAIGRGKVNTVCEFVDRDDPDDFQEIPVRVVAQGRNTFTTGHAVATGLAVTKDKGKVTDVRQWQPAAGLTLHE